MDLFSLLYGERPKLNNIGFRERKHHAEEGLDCEVKQAKTRFIDQKQFRQFPQKVIQNPRKNCDVLIFLKKNYTAIGNDDQTDQTSLISLRYAKSNKFSGLSYYNSHLIGHNSFLKREIIYRPVVSEPTDRYNHGKYRSMIKL